MPSRCAAVCQRGVCAVCRRRVASFLRHTWHGICDKCAVAWHHSLRHMPRCATRVRCCLTCTACQCAVSVTGLRCAEVGSGTAPGPHRACDCPELDPALVRQHLCIPSDCPQRLGVHWCHGQCRHRVLRERHRGARQLWTFATRGGPRPRISETSRRGCHPP
jgi:hypothetical protein